MHLPRLYPIADVGTLKARGLDLATFTRELLDGGAEILQLRDKNGAPQQVLAEAEVISGLVAGSPCLAVMNDRVDLALLAGWRAVHLGQGDLPPAAARGLAGSTEILLGISTHTEEQVREADAGPADYIAVGPIFSTSTKADAEPVVGLEGLRRARALTQKPLVAIGGITLENAAAVMEAGADSVAVIGGLFRQGQGIRAVVQDFLRRLR